MKLFIIVLNYNNEEDTIECLDSLKEVIENSKEIDVNIILVDNASDIKSVNTIKEYLKNNLEAVLLISNSNKGYAGGNNIGITYALNNGADYICILNNDVIVNRNFYKDSIRILEEDRNVYFVGPAILYYGTNIIQYTGGKVNLWFMKNTGINQGMEYVEKKEVVECDYVGGACLFFRSNIINELGYLPENYFLFWEETEWCMSALKRKKKCLCTLNNHVEHKGSASIDRVKGLGEYYIERNRIIFSRRNDNNVIRRIFAYAYLNAKAITKGVLRNKNYFNYVKYYFEGIRTII